MTTLKTPGGKARFLEHARERDDRSGRVGGRLDHDRVAGDQRRHRLPRGDRHRKVPRRDERADADGLTDAHGQLVRELRRRREPEEAPSFAGGEEGHVDRFLHVAARLRQHLPHLARHQPRELLLVALQDVARRVQDLGPPGRRRVSPAGERLLRGRDRGVHVRLAALREETDDVVPVGRVAILEGLAGCGRNPLSPDEVATAFRRRFPWPFTSPPIFRARRPGPTPRRTSPRSPVVEPLRR